MARLVKTILWAATGMVCGYFMSGDETLLRIPIMLGMAGVPCGWSFISRMGIVPVGFLGLVIHFVIAMLVGWVALPLELIMGIREVLKERRLNEKM